MQTSLDHLPPAKQRELERVVRILFEEFGDATAIATSPWKKQARILKVILYGNCRVRSRRIMTHALVSLRARLAARRLRAAIARRSAARFAAKATTIAGRALKECGAAFAPTLLC